MAIPGAKISKIIVYFFRKYAILILERTERNMLGGGVPVVGAYFRKVWQTVIKGFLYGVCIQTLESEGSFTFSTSNNHKS